MLRFALALLSLAGHSLSTRRVETCSQNDTIVDIEWCPSDGCSNSAAPCLFKKESVKEADIQRRESRDVISVDLMLFDANGLFDAVTKGNTEQSPWDAVVDAFIEVDKAVEGDVGYDPELCQNPRPDFDMDLWHESKEAQGKWDHACAGRVNRVYLGDFHTGEFQQQTATGVVTKLVFLSQRPQLDPSSQLTQVTEDQWDAFLACLNTYLGMEVPNAAIARKQQWSDSKTPGLVPPHQFTAVKGKSMAEFMDEFAEAQGSFDQSRYLHVSPCATELEPWPDTNGVRLMWPSGTSPTSRQLRMASLLTMENV